MRLPLLVSVVLAGSVLACAAGDPELEAGGDEEEGKSDGAIAVMPFALTAGAPRASFSGNCSEWITCDITARMSATDASAKQAAQQFFQSQPDATTFEWNWGEVWLERDGKAFDPSPAYGGRRALIKVDRDPAAADGLTVRRKEHVVGGIWELYDKFYWGDFRPDSAFTIQVQLAPDALASGVPQVDATIEVSWW